jgi:hypothetical protein
MEGNDDFLKTLACENVQRMVSSFSANVKKNVHFWLYVGIIETRILYYCLSFAIVIGEHEGCRRNI